MYKIPDASKPQEKAKESKIQEYIERPDEVFEWLQYEDTGDQRGRIANNLLANPFVPIGATATLLALCLGLYNMQKKNSAKQQFYMRARVGAQAFTIASILGGIFYQNHKRDTENQEKLQAKMKQGR